MQGGHKDSKTQELEADQDIYITFENVPVGRTINVYAQIYTLVEGEKQIIYAGTSESKIIQSEENLFQLMLDFAYDSYVETSSKYIVLRPLLSVERDERKLKSNKLEFKNDEDENKRDESFSWQLKKLSDYQKARVTFRGKDLPQASESSLRFRLVKSTTGARYVLETKAVSDSAQTYEFEIPQFINLDKIALENDWNYNMSTWAPDFTCYIDKIELIKDSSLIDPDFNKITKTDTTCKIINPPVQNIISTKIDKNIITFDSTQGRSTNPTGSGYSAAYWEFADLENYDRVSIKVKANNPNNFEQIRIVVKGYAPFNYPSVTQSHDGTDIQQIIEAADTTQILTLSRTQLVDGLDDNPLTAILFQNDSYTGEWITTPEEGTSADANLNYGEAWNLEIEEILLEKLAQFQLSISVPSSNSDINVVVKVNGETQPQTSDTPITVSSDKEIQFVADDNYTSYVWKVNSNVQTSATGNTFTLDSNLLLSGYNDIILLADNETLNLHHSWTAQITKE